MYHGLQIIRPGRPQPLTLLFADDDNANSTGRRMMGEIWSLPQDSSTANWDILAELDEQQIERIHHQFSKTAWLSVLMDLKWRLATVAHPLSVWEVDGPEPVNHYVRKCSPFEYL